MERDIFGTKLRDGQITDRHKSIMSDTMKPDIRNVKIVAALSDTYKVLADKLFENNKVMETMILTQVNTMKIYDYPVCGRCETVALPHEGVYNEQGKLIKSRCGCMRCGHITDNPATVRQWLKDEMKHRVGPDYFDLIDIGIEKMARSMMKTYLTNLLRTYGESSELETSTEPSDDKSDIDYETIV